MRLADWVTPQDLKDINLLLMLEAAQEIGSGAELRKRIRARAKMVPEARLLEVLAEIPEVTRAEARRAWSHWMALVTTRQPFFDANHRTALMGFNLAARKAWGLEYVLATAEMERLMQGNRALVQQAHKPGANAPRNATVEALRDPRHPVRLFFAGLEANLVEQTIAG